MTWKKLAWMAITLCVMAGMATPAAAELVLSQVIVDLQPDKPPREDIEVWNDGEERMYVAAEPFEIVGAGTLDEERVAATDPESSGILVSPQRLVLEPGERRIIRVAAIGERSANDRVYRVAIKPVAGPISAETSALKVLIGYDALVLVRPAEANPALAATRDGRSLVLRNTGNTAQELFDGRQCDAAGGDCRDLPAKRLYPGASWEQSLPFDTPVTYKTAVGPDIVEREF